MIPRRGLILRLLPLLAAACADPVMSPQLRVPEQIGTLRLTALDSVVELPLGRVDTLDFQLENIGRERINLTFPSGCQLLPYIADAGTGQIVHPAGGGWVCTAALSYLSLAPGDVRPLRIGIRGGAPQLAIYTEFPLEAGQYAAYATLANSDYPLRSATVIVRVR